MEPIESPRLIIDYCLSPLSIAKDSKEYREVFMRMEHVIKSYRAKAGRSVRIDFSQMPSSVINEAAFGHE